MNANRLYVLVLLSLLIIPVSAYAQEDQLKSTIAEVLNSFFPLDIDEANLIHDVLFLIIAPVAMVFAVIVGLLHAMKIFREPYWVQPVIATATAIGILRWEAWANIVSNIVSLMGLWAVLLFSGVFFIGTLIWGRGTVSGIRDEYHHIYKRTVGKHNAKIRKYMRRKASLTKKMHDASKNGDIDKANRLKDEINHLEQMIDLERYKAEKAANKGNYDFDRKRDGTIKIK